MLTRGVARANNSGGYVCLSRRDAHDNYEPEAANEHDAKIVHVVPPILSRVSLRVLQGHPGVVISII